MGDLVVIGGQASITLPAIIAEAGDKASEHFLEFFGATIRNKNTRAAYVRTVAQFCRWCEQHKLSLAGIRSLHMSAYIEALEMNPQSVKQLLAALRGLFNWLVIKQVVPDNPALFAKGPRFSRQIGVTPILESGQMRMLLDSIPKTREVKIPKKHGPSSPSWPILSGASAPSPVPSAVTTGSKAIAPACACWKRRQGKARLAAPRGGAIFGCVSGGGED
jgi:hypothetical protein